MSLHAQIMNLNCVPKNMDAEPNQRLAYKVGHRDARHAAAELANHAEAEIERQAEVIAEAKKIIEELCTCYGHPTPDATLERMTPNAELRGDGPASPARRPA